VLPVDDVVKLFGMTCFTMFSTRIPKIRVKTRQRVSLSGQRLVIALDDWPMYALDVPLMHRENGYPRTVVIVALFLYVLVQ
jgi:hypothetical protein